MGADALLMRCVYALHYLITSPPPYRSPSTMISVSLNSRNLAEGGGLGYSHTFRDRQCSVGVARDGNPVSSNMWGNWWWWWGFNLVIRTEVMLTGNQVNAKQAVNKRSPFTGVNIRTRGQYGVLCFYSPRPS